MSIFNSTSSSSVGGAVTKTYLDSLHLASQNYVNNQVSTIQNSATSSATPSTIVKRDATGAGGFSAGTIKATSLEVSGTTKITLPLKDATGTNIINLDTNSKYGKNVMPSLTTGTQNLGIGEAMLPNPTSGSANTFIGYGIAATSTGNPSWNTAVGVAAMAAVSSNNNTAIGHNSMKSLTSGSDNVAMGVNAGNSAGFLTTGSQNVLIGNLARLSDGTSSNAIAIGYQAQAPASNTIQLGNNLITNVFTSGVLNAAGLESIGTNSTLNIASQNNTNTVNIGSGSAVQTINVGNNGTGATTIKIGGGSDNVQVNMPLKDSAGTNILNIAGGNCSVGASAMPAATGGNNTVIGTNAGLDNILGSGNTFLGFESGKKGNGANLTLNTAVGHSSLLNITDGRDNVAIGHAALVGLSNGHSNTSIGKGSGGISTGTGNTFIGAYAASSVGTVTNSTAIGNSAVVDASNMIQLGNTSVSAVKTSGTLYALGLESIGTNSTLNIASANNTNTVNIGSGTAVQTINMGNNGAGATTINVGGGSDIVSLNGCKLPTTGGTASTLNYYEEYSGQMKFTNTVAETPLLNYQIVRIGRQVTFTIKEGVLMQSSATGEFITMNTTPIPSRFLPTHTIPFASIIIIKNYSREAGKVVIDMSDSKLHILGAANVYFANGGFNGFDPFSITYLI